MSKSSVPPQEIAHKAGFINIIGRPNVGKSTLSNVLVGERLSVITSKAQTTRHRILGIVNGENFQMVFSDTPGIIRDPKYKLHESMNRFVTSTFLDADIMLFMTEPGEKYASDDPILVKLRKSTVPVIILINKTDLADQEAIVKEIQRWAVELPDREIRPISALNKVGTDQLFEDLLKALPEHPPFFPKDALTDKPERFFVEEIIREKILLNYKQEIPYSVEIAVESFKEEEDIIRIRSLIYVNRKTQKSIIIGKGGTAIKKVGTAARKDMETFFAKKIYLELFVKVKEGWRDRDQDLRKFGYNQ